MALEYCETAPAVLLSVLSAFPRRLDSGAGGLLKFTGAGGIKYDVLDYGGKNGEAETTASFDTVVRVQSRGSFRRSESRKG